MRGKYDIIWKGMLEEVFEDLLRFVDPEVDKELDLSRGVEFLDKELAEMYPEPEKKSSTRVVDKLVKVYCVTAAKDGCCCMWKSRERMKKGLRNECFAITTAYWTDMIGM